MSQDKKSTPPVDPELPPTPPPTDERPLPPRLARLLRFCRAYEAGGGGTLSVHRKFPLSSAQFDQFERHLEQEPTLQGYVNDKLRLVKRYF